MHINPILIVDDDATICEFIKAVLVSEGYEVITADNGYHALEKLREREQPVSLILLDMRMPAMDGWELLTLYQEFHPPLAPVIALSGNVDAQLPSNVVAFLPKPFDVPDLLSLVEQYTKPSVMKT
jgi:two-component system, cell cycle sensor histidine kinase and response regulator CckA